MRTEAEIFKEAIRIRRRQPEIGNEQCYLDAGFLHGSAFALGLNTNDFCTEVDRRIERQDKSPSLMGLTNPAPLGTLLVPKE